MSRAHREAVIGQIFGLLIGLGGLIATVLASFQAYGSVRSSMFAPDQLCVFARRQVNPYPLHYKTAFAYSILPNPHACRLALRLAFLFKQTQETYGVSKFHVKA